jgi:hypothetical protein
MLRLFVLLTLLVGTLASAVSKRNSGPDTIFSLPSTYALPHAHYGRSLMLKDVRCFPRCCHARVLIGDVCRARARCWRRGRIHADVDEAVLSDLPLDGPWLHLDELLARTGDLSLDRQDAELFGRTS